MSLTSGVVLLGIFAWWQRRAANPLLPLRIVLDRTRGGSVLAIFLGGTGLFGASVTTIGRNATPVMSGE